MKTFLILLALTTSVAAHPDMPLQYPYGPNPFPGYGGGYPYNPSWNGQQTFPPQGFHGETRSYSSPYPYYIPYNYQGGVGGGYYNSRPPQFRGWNR